MHGLCVTLGQRRPYGLDFLPITDVLTESSGRWAVAANQLLDRVAGEPAYFFDDDIEFITWMPEECPFDVTGFVLCSPTSTGEFIIQSGGFEMPVLDGAGPVLVADRRIERLMQPAVYPHVTASCLWLSKRATERVRFPIWETGEHYEDVAFTLKAWLDGLSVGRIPLAVYHHIRHDTGVGATKSTNPEFFQRRMGGELELREWMKAANIEGDLRSGRIPSMAYTLAQWMAKGAGRQ